MSEIRKAFPVAYIEDDTMQNHSVQAKTSRSGTVAFPIESFPS